MRRWCTVGLKLCGIYLGQGFQDWCQRGETTYHALKLMYSIGQAQSVLRLRVHSASIIKERFFLDWVVANLITVIFEEYNSASIITVKLQIFVPRIFELLKSGVLGGSSTFDVRWPELHHEHTHTTYCMKCFVFIQATRTTPTHNS